MGVLAIFHIIMDGQSGQKFDIKKDNVQIEQSWILRLGRREPGASDDQEDSDSDWDDTHITEACDAGMTRRSIRNTAKRRWILESSESDGEGNSNNDEVWLPHTSQSQAVVRVKPLTTPATGRKRGRPPKNWSIAKPGPVACKEDRSHSDSEVRPPHTSQSQAEEPKNPAPLGKRRGRKPKSWSPSKPIEQVSPNRCDENGETVFESGSRQVAFKGLTSEANSKAFDSGKYVVLKSDLKTQKEPCLWRIDGKNLLQKYEPILFRESLAYHNISTYSSWTQESRRLYIPVETQFVSQSKGEMVVRFDPCSVVLAVSERVQERMTREIEDTCDSFRVYLQTLMSQALDDNFLTEINVDKDDYFLGSICAIEEGWVRPRMANLESSWSSPKIKELLQSYPLYELASLTTADQSCSRCQMKNPTRRMLFRPVTYSMDSMRESEFITDKLELILCLPCTDSALVYHQLFHFRYHTFKMCQAKVSAMKSRGDKLDDASVVQECMHDATWAGEAQKFASLILAEADHCYC